MPKFDPVFENTINPENSFTGRIQSITDDLSDFNDNDLGDNLSKPFEFNWDSNSNSNKFTNMHPDSGVRGINESVWLNPYLLEKELGTHNFLSPSDPIAKGNPQKSSEFDFKSSTAFKEPQYISPPIYNTPTISDRYSFNFVQIIVDIFKTLFALLATGLIIGLIVAIIYFYCIHSEGIVGHISL